MIGQGACWVHCWLTEPSRNPTRPACADDEQLGVLRFLDRSRHRRALHHAISTASATSRGRSFRSPNWLRERKRFAHLFRPEAAEFLEEIQRRVDEDWGELLGRCDAEAP
jgi:hypothetical protein